MAAVLFAPQAALADNECDPAGVDPSANLGLADAYDCGDTSYGDGVTYNADGDLTVEFTNGGITEAEDVGIDLSATGGDSIFFDSQSTATEIESRAVTGPLLSVTTVNGDISIATEEMDADGQTPGGVTHAIYAESTGSGSIDINTTGVVDARGSNPEDSIGIQAITGSGDLTITASDEVSGNFAAIDATAGSGLLTINVIGAGDFIDGGIRVNTGGSAVVNIDPDRTVNGLAGNLDAAIQATGSGTLTVNNDGRIFGVLDFSGLGGDYTFNNNAGAEWEPRGPGDLSGGVINNAGTIVVSDQFNRINVVSAPGATFTGTGDGTLQIGAILDGHGQSVCTAPTVAGCLDLSGGTTAGQTSILVSVPQNSANPDPFADSIDRPISPGVVVVDVSGGVSAADHFVLDPDSFQRSIGINIYAEDPVYGGVLKTGGLFDYALLYNPNTQQHLLASVPNRQGVEYVALIHESLSVWHTTSDAVAGRQADLRDGGERGGWVRTVNDSSERDFAPTLTTHGNTFTHDRRYTLDTRAVIAGYDLTADDNHVFGLHLGFVGTQLDHDDSSTKDEAEFFSGASSTFGAYAGWWNDAGLTLDGTLNVALLDIRHNVMSSLEDTWTNVLTTGIRAEAGWRFPVTESFYVQPLATAAYAYADVENLNFRDYDATFEDTQSQRAALGVRLGGSTDTTNERFSRVKYWLTARAWEEYAGDGNVQFQTSGDPLVIEDDLSGSFQELGMGVSLANSENTRSVFLSGNSRFGNDINSFNVSVGARLNW